MKPTIQEVIEGLREIKEWLMTNMPVYEGQEEDRKYLNSAISLLESKEERECEVQRVHFRGKCGNCGFDDIPPTLPKEVEELGEDSSQKSYTIDEALNYQQRLISKINELIKAVNLIIKYLHKS